MTEPSSTRRAYSRRRRPLQGSGARAGAGAGAGDRARRSVDSLLSVRSQEQRTVRRLIHGQLGDYEQHLGIFGAVREGDAAQARALTRAHLLQVHEEVARHLE